MEFADVFGMQKPPVATSAQFGPRSGARKSLELPRSRDWSSQLPCLFCPSAGRLRLALFGLKQRAPSGSGLVVEPQYYLTGGPRQGYTFKSPEVFQFSRSKAVAECATEVLLSSLGFGGRNAFSVEWHSVSRHRQPAPCRLS